jgi:L-methionine (R)-S-oxide reductase
MSEKLPSLLSSPTPDWDAVLEDILARMGCVTGTLHRLGAESGLLEIVTSRGIPEVLMPKIARIPIGKGIAGAAAEKRGPVQMCNLQTDTSGVARPDAKQTGVAGSLAVPVLDAEGELVGTLGVGMTVPHEFTDEESARLAEIAADLAAPLRTIA